MNAVPKIVRSCRLCNVQRAFHPARISRAIHISRTPPSKIASGTRRTPGYVVQYIQTRSYVQKDQRETKSYATVKEAMQEIEEAYDGAREEFQIAAEETQENTVYAAEDRKAARGEFDKLKALFEQYIDGEGLEPEGKEELQKRAGHRIRELEQALRTLENDATGTRQEDTPKEEHTSG